MDLDTVLRKMDKYTLQELREACVEYDRHHTRSSLEKISDILKNWGCDEKPEEFVKVLTR